MIGQFPVLVIKLGKLQKAGFVQRLGPVGGKGAKSHCIQQALFCFSGSDELALRVVIVAGLGALLFGLRRTLCQSIKDGLLLFLLFQGPGRHLFVNVLRLRHQLFDFLHGRCCCVAFQFLHPRSNCLDLFDLNGKMRVCILLYLVRNSLDLSFKAFDLLTKILIFLQLVVAQLRAVGDQLGRNLDLAKYLVRLVDGVSDRLQHFGCRFAQFDNALGLRADNAVGLQSGLDPVVARSILQAVEFGHLFFYFAKFVIHPKLLDRVSAGQGRFNGILADGQHIRDLLKRQLVVCRIHIDLRRDIGGDGFLDRIITLGQRPTECRLGFCRQSFDLCRCLVPVRQLCCQIKMGCLVIGFCGQFGVVQQL